MVENTVDKIAGQWYNPSAGFRLREHERPPHWAFSSPLMRGAVSFVKAASRTDFHRKTTLWTLPTPLETPQNQTHQGFATKKSLG